MAKWSWNMSTKRVIALLLLGLLAGFLGFKAARAPAMLQHAFLPPALGEPAGGQDAEPDGEEARANQEEGTRQEEPPLTLFLRSWENLLEETEGAYTAALLRAHLPKAQLATADGGSAQAELTAVYGQLHTFKPDVLVNGRHLYQEEADDGSPSAVIDEALAIALFRQGEPVGMRFTLLGREFTVVGVVRHSRLPGERAEYGLEVPLKAFKSQPAWEMMSASFLPKGGSGTRSGLAGALGAWQPGQSIDLVKESYRALLPLRVLLCGLGAALAVIGLRLAWRVSAGLVHRAKGWLDRQYAARLLHRFILVGLAIALMFMAGLALLLFAFTQLLEVVYIFPEWVPAILVEPREISKTFWENQAAASALLSLRTRELLYLQSLRGWLSPLALLMAGLLITPLSRLYAAVKKD